MLIEGLATDGTTGDLVLKSLCYTVYYAAIAWLPLRFAADAVIRFQGLMAHRKTNRSRRPPRLRRSYYVIR